MFQRSAIWTTGACLLVVGLMGLTGCRKEKSEREERTIKGTALNVDEATSKVSMRYYNKKKQVSMTLEGTVTPNTEILINGRVAQLGEIKSGEQVVVTGYTEKTAGQRKLVAMKVEVQRDEWLKAPSTTTKSATKPTTKPAR